VSELYEVVIFTASMSRYANPLLDTLDPNHYISSRLFRGNCTPAEGGFIKDLTILGRNLKDVIIIDNAPISYSLQQSNALPINTWTGDETDTQLFDYIPILKLLAKVKDVRDYLTRIVKGNKVDYREALRVFKSEFGDVQATKGESMSTPQHKYEYQHSSISSNKYAYTEPKVKQSLNEEFEFVKSLKVGKVENGIENLRNAFKDEEEEVIRKCKEFKALVTPEHKALRPLSNYLKTYTDYTEPVTNEYGRDNENELSRTPGKFARERPKERKLKLKYLSVANLSNSEDINYRVNRKLFNASPTISLSIEDKDDVNIKSEAEECAKHENIYLRRRLYNRMKDNLDYTKKYTEDKGLLKQKEAATLDEYKKEQFKSSLKDRNDFYTESRLPLYSQTEYSEHRTNEDLYTRSVYEWPTFLDPYVKEESTWYKEVNSFADQSDSYSDL